jgi:hypothetical protein
MWGMLTAETFQPILEFDFLGPDSWAALGKSEAEVVALAVPDKLEQRGRQVGRRGGGLCVSVVGGGGIPSGEDWGCCGESMRAIVMRVVHREFDCLGYD